MNPNPILKKEWVEADSNFVFDINKQKIELRNYACYSTKNNLF